jgi:Uma2 family endonuclease
MTALPKPLPFSEPEPDPPSLHSGDRMTREEFHRVYEQMPEKLRAELVEGIVYVASPLRRRHGNRHPLIGSVLVAYEGNTPGVEMGDNTTVLLGDEGEPQPDLHLRVLPEHGGQSRTTEDDYVEGAPELIIEVAHSTRALDLHAKKRDYARYGVREYVVWTLTDNRFHWFDLPAGQQLQPGADGVLHVRTFPGLWIDVPAVVAKDYNRMMATLQQGLATPEHAAFVEQLRLAAGRVAQGEPPPRE